MRNQDRYEEQSEGSRVGKQAAIGGAFGALQKFMDKRGAAPHFSADPALGALESLAHGKGSRLAGHHLPSTIAGHGALGAAAAGGRQAIGDALLGQPTEHGFIDEAKRGALGGAIMGVPLGIAGAGMSQHGAGLVHYLMKSGMGKKAAIALALGGGALAGSASGALSGGLDSGLMNYEPETRGMLK